MANKWEITLDVTEGQVATLVKLLDAEISKRSDALKLTADETEWWTISGQIESLKHLRGGLKLAWIEREVEIVPPPNEWSAALPVADARSAGPYPTREMVRRWHRDE